MAPLDRPRWEAVTPQARDLLVALGRLPLMSAFYLAGGTGLALRLGHCISVVDFDIADRQEEPTMLQSTEWEQVKAFFRAEACRLGRAWFFQE